MKRLLLAVAAGIGLIAAQLPAAAKQYAPTTLSWTNVVPAAATNASVGTITVTKHDLFALQVTFKLQGAGTTAVVAKLYESLDGTTFDDTAVSTLSITPAGTAQVSGVLPVSSTAVGYFRVALENPNASAVTNAVWTVATKPKRNG